MNDRYLYKAKRKHDSKFFKKCEWVEGAYYIEPYTNKCFIIQWNSTGLGFNEFIEVDEESVCQCTGLKDKNGKLIWENDVCKYYNPEDKDGIAIIKEDYASWISGTIRQTEIMTPMFYLKCGEEWEVIGNIFESPELINE